MTIAQLPAEENRRISKNFAGVFRAFLQISSPLLRDRGTKRATAHG
jgi:hypothetical protein